MARGSHFPDRELASNRVEKLFLRQAIEIVNDAVVSKYLHLRIGEDHSQKIVVIFFAGMREALFFNSARARLALAAR